MSARITRRGIPAAAIWGGFGVLAWAALTLFTGGAQAHADESKGPIDGLTGLVSNTVTTITTPVVTQVVAPVVTKTVPAVVSTVTQTVAKVPVVGPVTTPIVKTVSETAQTVVKPVIDVVKSSPVSQITTPVIDLVTGLPVVGGIVDTIGVPELVDGVVGIVDDTTSAVGEVVEEVVPPVLTAIDPTAPATPQIPGIPSIPGVPGVAVTPSAPTTPVLHGVEPEIADAAASAPVLDMPLSLLAPAVRAATERPTIAAATYTAPSDNATGPNNPTPSPDDLPATAPPGAPSSPSSSSAGPGGSSPAATARISDDGIPLLRAEKQVHGATDAALPASAVADTDVSPD